MIFKDYNRNIWHSILMILLGVILLIDSFRGNFILIYNGLEILVAIVSIVIGLWGIITPVASINDNQFIVRLSIGNTKMFDLSQTQLDFDFDHILITSNEACLKFKLRHLSSDGREELIKDLKCFEKN